MNEKYSEWRGFLKAYAQKVIAFNPIYAQITGSVNAGLLLSQIVFLWGSLTNTDEFYHTNDQFREELCMGLDALRRARTRLKKLQIIKVKRKGIPPKMHYKLNVEKLKDLVTHKRLYGNPIIGKPDERTSGNHRNI